MQTQNTNTTRTNTNSNSTGRVVMATPALVAAYKRHMAQSNAAMQQQTIPSSILGTNAPAALLAQLFPNMYAQHMAQSNAAMQQAAAAQHRKQLRIARRAAYAAFRYGNGN